MRRQKTLARSLFFLFLLACLLTGLAGIGRVPVSAASPNIVISQVYGGGGNSGAPYKNDFIELYNLGTTTVSLSSWSIQYASASGNSWDVTNLSGDLAPGQYYLVQLDGGTTGSDLPTPDITDTTDMSATAGKIALVNTVNPLTDIGCPFSASVIDFVGYGTSANCYETAVAPAPSNTTAILRTNVCTDTDNNSTNFATGAPNPRNTTSTIIPCLRVIDISSSVADGTYQRSAVIPIQITFSTNVNVNVFSGTPTLTLETGTNDTKAVYASGSGTDKLTFNYTVVSGDVSVDLDYVSPTALVLNGGTITGAVGNAVLTLPDPGTPGSLGANKDIVIDNAALPVVNFIKRQDPLSSPTNSDTLKYRVTFNEPVTNVDALDFAVNGATGTSIVVDPVTVDPAFSSIYDVTITGGDLPTFNGNVGLDVSNIAAISDKVGNALALPAVQPPTDETYTLDNTRPTVTINQAASQPDPTGGTPINFTVVFSEVVKANDFSVADIYNVPASGITWRITPSSDPKIFTLSAIAITLPGVTVLTPLISADTVTDLAGNLNDASTFTDHSVKFDNSYAPSVTINQASGQEDPVTSLPVKFTVVFSKAIVASIFTPDDIRQNGTASGITWTITNSGDNTNFTLSATAVSKRGTLIPSIDANRVLDLVGNNNLASTSADNSVLYTSVSAPTATPTRTLTPPPPPPLLAINEFVPRPGHDWNNDGAINTGDEYIEIINYGIADVNLSGYKLDDEVNIGSGLYTLPSVTLKPGDRYVFYGSQTGLLLSDGGDGVRLLKPNGQLMDAYNYSVVQFPDQSFCRLPDDGGADQWSTNCYPTPGLRNSLSGSILRPPTLVDEDQPLCPIADTLPEAFVLAECAPFGNNIWNRYYWDKFGWYGEMSLPNVNGKWEVFAD